MPVMDDRDRQILADRQAQLRDRTEPGVGDHVLFADGVRRRISETWGGESFQTSDGGSFYLGNGYVSFSGALHPGVPRHTLTDTGRFWTAPVWFFHHDHRARDNGVDTEASFRIWRCSLPAT